MREAGIQEKAGRNNSILVSWQTHKGAPFVGCNMPLVLRVWIATASDGRWGVVVAPSADMRVRRDYLSSAQSTPATHPIDQPYLQECIMQRTTLFLTIALATSIVTPISALAAKTSIPPTPVKRVVPQGPDGDSFFYQVTCKDNSVTSVVQKLSKDETCAYPHKKPKQCKSSWPLQFAANAACGG